MVVEVEVEEEEVVVVEVEVEVVGVAACDTFGHSCRRARNSASTLPVHQQSALAERCIWGGAKLGGSGSSGWSSAAGAAAGQSAQFSGRLRECGNKYFNVVAAGA